MRLDKYLSEKFGSRNKAANAIEKGYVKVNDKVEKRDYIVKNNDNITFIEPSENYVSVGGFKLSKALKDFGFSVQNKIFADIGASTGGFTDCLLQNGAQKVYCIDVGESQLDKSLLHKNVIIIDNFNARNLSKDIFSEDLDGVVIDVSFISLTYILQVVSNILDNGKCVLALIKPQFECNNKGISKNGIVSDKKIHEAVIKKIYDFANLNNLAAINLTNAPIISGKNIEYIILLIKDAQPKSLKSLINNVKL